MYDGYKKKMKYLEIKLRTAQDFYEDNFRTPLATEDK